jgi:hypothetical protein
VLEFVQGFGGKADHLEDKGVDGRMGSEWILGRLVLGCGLDVTTQGRDRW